MACRSCDLKRIYKLFEEKKRRDAEAAKEAVSKEEIPITPVVPKKAKNPVREAGVKAAPTIEEEKNEENKAE